RSCWARELDHCIAELHKAGIVWEDDSPYNVLVNHKFDIWLVEFGGSYAPGLVDKAVRETIEGDLQGVEGFKSFLY
ncbi:hypothetical protein BJ878DRAFT_387051, partial [Calycina marina]